MIIKKIKNAITNRWKKLYQFIIFYPEKKRELERKLEEDKDVIWFIGSAHYDNIGDQAISYATIKFLNNYFPNYTLIEIRLCDYYKYLKAIKKLAKKDDIIVMQGGGNMGFYYFDAEVNRRNVIKSFPDNQIIIFPSTIDYGTSPRALHELNNSIKIYNKHKKLTICAREEKSYYTMKELYKNNNIILVPDIVLWLNIPEFSLKREKVGLCLRRDIEKTNLSNEIFNKFKNESRFVITDNVSTEKNITSDMREKIFIDKLKEFSSYEVVITDRLHTMIFCEITETPCLFLDNSNGKVNGVYSLWISQKCDYIEKIDSNIKQIEQQIDSITKLKNKQKIIYENQFKILVENIKAGR